MLASYIAFFFYEEPVLIEVIRVYAIIFLLTAFSAVQSTILNKEMNFKKLTLISLPSTFLEFLWDCIWAIMIMVFGVLFLYLTTELIRTILLWVFGDWRPSLNFFKTKI